MAGDDIVLQGTGQETRDFIHASDVANAAVHVITAGAMAGETYNVGTGKATTIAQLAQMIVSRLSSQKPVRFDNVPVEGMPIQWQADISRIALLGFHPLIDIGDGITDTVDWFRQGVTYDTAF